MQYIENQKDPLKRRWLRIVQNMDTHLNGMYPLHIYFNRRPLESSDPYALEQRIAEFEPLTKEAFDLALSKIEEICSNANVKLNAPEYIQTSSFKLFSKDFWDFCISDMQTKRENDPNAVIVLMPQVEELDNNSVIVSGYYPKYVSSFDIVKAENDYLEFFLDKVEDKERYLIIKGGQYSFKIDEDIIPIVNLPIDVAFKHVSSNIVYENYINKTTHKPTLLTYRMPYLYGSVAWGNKFYGQESDFTIQAKRFTYLREYRAKEKCTEPGMRFINGVHCNDETKEPCGICKGSGYIRDDSPLGTTFVDFDALLTGDAEKLPPLVQWSEPPQQAIQHSKEIMNEYYDRMLNSLGIVKQNMTNQSGVSKSYDWKQSIKIIYSMLNDSMGLLQWFYRTIEQVSGTEPSTKVYLVGELEATTLEDLLNKLLIAKQNQSPPNIIESIIDSILLKTLNPEFSELVVEIAKEYDILYLYGKDEMTTAKAHFGTAIGVKEIYIHNTIISKIEYFITQGIEDKEQLIIALDNFYNNKFQQNVTFEI